MPPSPRLTHFLCIPLVTSTSKPQLQRSLATFKEDVTTLRTPAIPEGVPEKAIRPLDTLHLTLGVMSLLTPERVESALKQLQRLDMSQILSDSYPFMSQEGYQAGYQANIGTEHAKNSSQDSSSYDSSTLGSISPPQLSMTLKGLKSMHAPSKTSILYSSPLDPDLRLYCFCQKLREIFTTAGLLVPETRPLLLHATVVNTIYVPKTSGRGSYQGKKRAKLTLDARQLLIDYEDFEWMSGTRVERIAICRMGAQKNADGHEEYIVEGQIDLPQ